MKKQNEQGRSMVEMLGVLAVVGVLSVTGIIGFRLAMAKHRANEMMQSASIGLQNMQLGQAPRFLNVEGAQFRARPRSAQDRRDAYVVVEIADRAACEQLRNLAGGQWTVEGNCEDMIQIGE